MLSCQPRLKFRSKTIAAVQTPTATTITTVVTIAVGQSVEVVAAPASTARVVITVAVVLAVEEVVDMVLWAWIKVVVIRVAHPNNDSQVNYRQTSFASDVNRRAITQRSAPRMAIQPTMLLSAKVSPSTSGTKSSCTRRIGRSIRVASVRRYSSKTRSMTSRRASSQRVESRIHRPGKQRHHLKSPSCRMPTSHLPSSASSASS